MTILEKIQAALAGLGVEDSQIAKAAKALADDIGEVIGKKDHEAAVAKAAKDAVAAVKPEEVEGFDEAVTKAVEAKMEDLNKSDDDKLKEGMTPEQVKKFEALAADSEATKAELKKMREEKKAEAIAKRVEPLATIVKVDDLVPVLAKLGDQDAEVLETALKAAAEQVSKADAILTKAKGHSTPVEGSAEAELNAEADKIAKAENITFFQAFRKATENNPALLKRYRDEQQAN